MSNVGKVNSRFWEGKRVLVTGHTGFKGAWLTFWLNSMGANVLGFALRPATTPSLFDVMGIKDICQHVEGDIRDRKYLKQVVADFKPEIVFHMAAQALVLASYEDPALTYETNVIGTLNLFEAVRGLTSLKTLVNITTDKVYDNKEWNWGYREHDALGGFDPYSSSKACSEILTSSIRRSFFKDDEVRILTCRAGNVFGGGDWSDNRLVPDAMRAFSQKKPLQIRNPFSVRPWQHVLEPLRAYLILAEKSFVGIPSAFAYNIGPGDSDALPVSELATTMASLWGDGASWVCPPDAKPGPHEAKFLKLDCSQAKTELNWHPLITLKSGLDMTVRWYKSYYEQGNSDKLKQIMREQIANSVE